MGAGTWGVLLTMSSALEWVALVGAVFLLAITLWQGQLFSTRSALEVSPFIIGAFSTLVVASSVNLVNMVGAATSAGLVAGAGDDLNVLLGLFGFLMPIALAMSA